MGEVALYNKINACKNIRVRQIKKYYLRRLDLIHFCVFQKLYIYIDTK